MSKIRIGPIIYQIEHVEDLRGDKNEALYGQADHVDFKIRLLNKHTRESEFLTLWHEVVHCIDVTFDIGLAEHKVNLLGCAIAQALQDNPRLNWMETND